MSTDSTVNIPSLLDITVVILLITFDLARSLISSTAVVYQNDRFTARCTMGNLAVSCFFLAQKHNVRLTPVIYPECTGQSRADNTDIYNQSNAVGGGRIILPSQEIRPGIITINILGTGSHFQFLPFSHFPRI